LEFEAEPSRACFDCFPLEEKNVLVRAPTMGLERESRQACTAGACLGMPNLLRALVGHHNNLNKTGIQKAFRFFVQRANVFDLRMSH
jgi:hypothetical protein